MEEIIRNAPPEELRWCTFCRRVYFVGLGTFQDRTIENVYAGKEIVSCDGGNFISLIHALDIASVIVTALMCAPAGSVFNGASKGVNCNEQY